MPRTSGRYLYVAFLGSTERLEEGIAMDVAFDHGMRKRQYWKERLTTAGLSLVLLVVLLWMRCCSKPTGRRSADRDVQSH